MKRRVFEILLCAFLIVLAITVRFPVYATGGNAEIQTGETVGSTLEWRSYEDFLYEESEKAWNRPSRFIDMTATFNVEYISSFVVTDGLQTIEEEELDSENFIEVTSEELLDENGNSIQVVIKDYVFNPIDEETGDIWYRVEAVEGYELPEVMKNSPYVLYAVYKGDIPSLLMQPQMGMFIGDEVTLQKEPVVATRDETISASLCPTFFEVKYVWSDDADWYDLGDTSSWEGANSGYRYVTDDSVILIPAEVTRAYEKLMSAEDCAAYENTLIEIPEEVLAQFSDKHKANVEAHADYLYAIENVEYTTEAVYGETTIPITVRGKIPTTGVRLDVKPVLPEDVLRQGFDIRDPEQIITAFDIKILNEADESEWQPADGDFVYLTIGMAELGYEDGHVVRLHHKHGDRIEKRDMFVVEDGKLTIRTGGFSIYAVESLGDTSGTLIRDGATYQIAVGDEAYFYCNSGSYTNWGQTTHYKGTWTVEDPDGAIHYIVYSGDASNAIGADRVTARWIKINTLKETGTTNVKLRYSWYVPGNGWGNSGEVDYVEFELQIVAPKAEPGTGKRLYIKDLVNTTGNFTAALVDESGKEIADGLVGAAFSWKRSDGLFVVPAAYEDNYYSVNIARDHGGLVEARKTTSGYTPITYTLKAILADGTELDADYTVYYQSEIINAGFEFPDSESGTYSFFPNGWPELYWKTTAPGVTGMNLENITKDIEYIDIVGANVDQFGVSAAADANAEVPGRQFAELNAEAFGALYQDIITSPREDIEWKFSHAGRKYENTTGISNSMFIVVGPTEEAQSLTADNLSELRRQILTIAGTKPNGDQTGNTGFYSGNTSVTVTYGGAEYVVWYHTAAEIGKWYELKGSYTVPANQYRTRIFFMTDESGTTSSTENFGNLIDASTAGQYKEYLVEYYVETYDGTTKKIERIDSKQESGEMLIYSTVALQNFDTFLGEGYYYYLHKVLINGKNYPYDIRYMGNASLYAEKYEGVATDQLPGGTKKYGQYDIVMQVFFRDTVIAVEKEIKFPTELTDEQKLNLMGSLKNGYEATYELSARTGEEDSEGTKQDDASVSIKNRDLAGKYKGYVALGDNPPLQGYRIKEAEMTDLVGLELDTVTIGVTRYKYGDGEELEEISYNTIDIEEGKEIVSQYFELNTEAKIADVSFTNTYREKVTTMYYKAIGKGKVRLSNSISYEDVPSEKIAFYSGKSVGVDVDCGIGASFDGWYLDEACTISVESITGIGVVEDDGTFKPNANLMSTFLAGSDEVTFYANFITPGISIEKTSAEPEKTFLYKVEGNNGFCTYATVTCDANGYGRRLILDVVPGTYKVTEIGDWSWRHRKNHSQTKSHNEQQTEADKRMLPFVMDCHQCDNNCATDCSTLCPEFLTKWLDGFSAPKKNVAGGGSQ